MDSLEPSSNIRLRELPWPIQARILEFCMPPNTENGQEKRLLRIRFPLLEPEIWNRNTEKTMRPTLNQPFFSSHEDNLHYILPVTQICQEYRIFAQRLIGLMGIDCDTKSGFVQFAIRLPHLARLIRTLAFGSGIYAECSIADGPEIAFTGMPALEHLTFGDHLERTDIEKWLRSVLSRNPNLKRVVWKRQGAVTIGFEYLRLVGRPGLESWLPDVNHEPNDHTWLEQRLRQAMHRPSLEQALEEMKCIHLICHNVTQAYGSVNECCHCVLMRLRALQIALEDKCAGFAIGDGREWDAVYRGMDAFEACESNPQIEGLWDYCRKNKIPEEARRIARRSCISQYRFASFS